MKRMAFILGLMISMLSYQDVHAQGFWYLPPGGDFSYRYGIDLGNGFGYGYSFGYGYGSFVSPEAATATAYSDLMQLQGQLSVGSSQVCDYGDTCDGLSGQQTLPALKTEIDGPKKADQQNSLQAAGAGKSNMNQRTTAIEFNRVTGKVNWPAVLAKDAFDSHRLEMEVLLVSVAKTGITPGLKARIDDKTQEIHDAIRRQSRVLSSKEYSEGHRFINRLAFEAQLPST